MVNLISPAVRRLAEVVSRKRVFKRRIHVGGQRVPLFVSPDAQLKYMRIGAGAFDADLLRIAECLVSPSDVVWDVGANVGVFSFAAACMAHQGTTIAVEADIWLGQLIRQSAQLEANKKLSIRVIPCAISDRNGVATFDIATRGRASSALRESGGRSGMGGVRASIDVPTLTLDTLAKHVPAPTFIKIDVEGAEMLVLKGAEGIIRKARPLIYVEVGNEAAPAVRAFAQSLDYVLCDERGVPPASSDQSMFNTFLVPQEQQDRTPLADRLR